MLSEHDAKLRKLLEQDKSNSKLVEQAELEFKQIEQIYNETIESIKKEIIKILNSSSQKHSRILKEIETIITDNEAFMQDDMGDLDQFDFLPEHLSDPLRELKNSMQDSLEKLSNLNNLDNTDIKTVKELDQKLITDASKYQQLLENIKQYQASSVKRSLEETSHVLELINTAIKDNTNDQEEYTLPDSIDLKGLYKEITAQRKQLEKLQSSKDINLEPVDFTKNLIKQFKKYTKDIKIYREIEQAIDPVITKYDDLINNVISQRYVSNDTELEEMAISAKEMLEKLQIAKKTLWDKQDYKTAMKDLLGKARHLDSQIRYHQSQAYSQQEQDVAKIPYQNINMEYDDLPPGYVKPIGGEQEYKPDKLKVDPSWYAVGHEPNRYVERHVEKVEKNKMSIGDQITSLKMLQKSLITQHDIYLKKANNSTFNKPHPKRKEVIEDVERRLDLIIKLAELDGKLDEPFENSLKAIHDLLKQKQKEIKQHHNSKMTFGRKSRLAGQYDQMLNIVKDTAQQNKIKLEKIKDIGDELKSAIADVDPNIDYSTDYKR